MPKLPSNLVKPPAFDNPLRRTIPAARPSQDTLPDAAPSSESTASELSSSGDREGGIVIPIVANARANEPTESAAATMPHRITVRIDDATRCALESECYKRRIAGDKTNLAEIARGILAQWASRTE